MRCTDPNCEQCHPRPTAAELPQIIEALGRIADTANDQAEQLAEALAELKEQQRDEYIENFDWWFAGWLDWLQLIEVIRRTALAVGYRRPEPRSRGPPAGGPFGPAFL